ncbi:hypothetical protein OAU50_03465 [Planctomycetota bacterium]|nr:hypothetical protein [Planctomycetota bacterium]
MNVENLIMEWMRDLNERANSGNSSDLQDNKHLVLAVLRDFAILRVNESIEGRVNESDIEFAISGLACLEKTVNKVLRNSVSLALKDFNRIADSVLMHWL